MVEIKQERITIKRAKELLEYGVANRSIKSRKVQQLAIAIERGEWRSDNPQPIMLNEQGAMIDGQHRLHAIILAKKATTMFVAYGVKNATMTVVDTGVARKLSDVLQINGEVNTIQLAGTLKQVYLWRTEKILGGKKGPREAEATTVELLELLEGEPEIRDAVRYTHTFGKSGLRIPPSIIGSLYYLCSEVNQEDADAFFTSLRIGEGLVAGDPIFVLRRLLLTESRQVHQSPARRTAALIIKAWKAWRAGETLEVIVWRGGGSRPEPFPDIAT